MSKPWMPLYVADYLRDTRRLTLAEHGAYLLLIMEYWTAKSLPNDDRQLARIIGASPAEWRKIKPAVTPFFDEQWRHKRIDKELAHAEQVSSKRSANAKQRLSNSSANDEQKHTHAGATSQSQSPSLPNGKAAQAASTDEKQLYDRGKALLGKEAGGLIKRLVTAKGGDVALARSALEMASTKSDPREYLGGVLRGDRAQQDSFLDPKAGIL